METIEEVFDYIIIGAGSAGAVLANRLSADERTRVLLLEAGKPNNIWTRIPIGFGRLIENPDANWCYSAEPEENTNGRRMPVPRGKLLGGSSAINGMIFVRGQPLDYDTWAQLGNRGWSYREVLPFFQKMEHFDGGDEEYRGRSGPLRVTEIPEVEPLYQAILDASQQAGLPFNSDYNGASQEGVSISQTTISRGRRQSTAHCYLEPAKTRSNLKIISEALADCLLFEGSRCVGVSYSRRGTVHKARAGREVIVSAGSVKSPQLLELSGIGQSSRLRNLGIDIVHDLAGVGENLRDHYAPRMRWRIGARGFTYNDKARGLGIVREAFKFFFKRTGLLGLPAAPVRAFFRTRGGLESPDACIGWFPLLVAPGYRIDEESGITTFTHPLRSESTGSIHIGSDDPYVQPEINFNFLSSPPDAQITLHGIRMTREIMGMPAMQHLQVEEIFPNPGLQDDDELMAWVKQTAETTYHPVGTCKMGSDPLAVVDERLRVHGLTGLRVADASIMPTLSSGNTNAPSIMIGEKASEMILADAA